VTRHPLRSRRRPVDILAGVHVAPPHHEEPHEPDVVLGEIWSQVDRRALRAEDDELADDIRHLRAAADAPRSRFRPWRRKRTNP
jgi:hypothetical protein